MYNLSLKVWNTYYFKNIDMFTFVKIYTFDFLEILSLKNKFNYVLSENSWQHVWIKLLKLALSSYNGPYPKHGGHVLILEKKNPWKGLTPWVPNSFYCKCIHFSPHQFGAATKGKCEAMIHGMRCTLIWTFNLTRWFFI